MKSTQKRTALAGKNATELQTELEALLKEQFGLRMQVATQQLTNTSKLKDVRRGIARVRTLLGQKEAVSAAGRERAPQPPAKPKQGAPRMSPQGRAKGKSTTERGAHKVPL